MFYLTARVGNMLAVYDDSDSVVEWFDKVQLDEYLQMGIKIMGYANGNVNPVSDIHVPYDKCNWTKSKKNIFNVAKSISISKGIMLVVAEDKKYKGKIVKTTSDMYEVRFSNGLTVTVPVTIINRKKV